MSALVRMHSAIAALLISTGIAVAELSVDDCRTLVEDYCGYSLGDAEGRERTGPSGRVDVSFRDAEHGLDWDVNATDGHIARWWRRDAVADPDVLIGDAEAIDVAKAEASNALGDRARGLVWTTKELPDSMVEARGESSDGRTVVTCSLLQDGTVLIYNQTLHDEAQALPEETAISEAEAIAIAQEDLDLEGFYPSAGLGRHFGTVAWHVTLSDYESVEDIPPSGPRGMLYIIDANSGRLLERARTASTGWSDRPPPPGWYEAHGPVRRGWPVLYVALGVAGLLVLWGAVVGVKRMRRRDVG